MKTRPTGFTLIELLLALAIGGAVMLLVSSSFSATLRARTTVEATTESTEAGARILNLLTRDLHALWHHNIKDNRVFIGRNDDVAGFPADRIDFLCSTDSVGTVFDIDEKMRRSSVNEVGYWVKDNPEVPGLLQLWRREDPMVDDKLLEGGSFQLVHDRLRKFNITYYKTKGHSAEEFLDWDSSQEDQLPRVMKIEFELERLIASRNRVNRTEIADEEELIKKYTHFIVFDKQFKDILMPNTALVPVIPPGPPEQQAAGGEGGAGPGGGPAGGPAGKGGGRGKGGDMITQGRNGTEMRRPGGEGMRQPGGARGGGRGGAGGTGGRGGGGGAGQLPGGFFPGSGSNQNFNLGDLFKQFGGGGGR